jgi:hypothetical protein
MGYIIGGLILMLVVPSILLLSFPSLLTCHCHFSIGHYEPFFICHCEPFLFVIASAAWQSRWGGIAELVPSETKKLMLQFASATPRNRYQLGDCFGTDVPRNDRRRVSLR